MQSTNGTYLNGASVHRERSPENARLELALGGPLIQLEIERPSDRTVFQELHQPASISQLTNRYFVTRAPGYVGAHTRIIRLALLRKQLVDKLQKLREQEESYGNFARELGISQDKLSEEDWLIYKIARIFGECDVNMPDGFVENVRAYIHKWQSTPRLKQAIERARVNGYGPQIAQLMLTHDLPQEFFYLALQESDFDNPLNSP